MTPYQQRAIDDKADLDARLAELSAFSQTREYHDMDIAERVLLLRQASLLAQLDHVLCERIRAFT